MVVMFHAPIDAVPPGQYVPTADERIVMHAPWELFRSIVVAKGERRRPKVTYLRGALELMSPSNDHERINMRFAEVIEEYMLHLGIAFDSVGAWYLENVDEEAALEPDSCFIIGRDPDQPRPDLAVEVVWTSGGLDKLEVYRLLGVPEVWFWIDGKVTIHVLVEGRYEPRDTSPRVPGIDFALVNEMLLLPMMSDVKRELRRRFGT
jgi:Uma2 family endonuclease